MRNFLKKWGLLIAVACIGVVLGTFTYFSVNNPAPAPAPEPNPVTGLVIIGPVSATAGDVVVYTTETAASSYTWDVTPAGRDVKVLGDGRTLMVIYAEPGKYTVVLAAGGNEILLDTHETLVDGTRPPSPGPAPDPDPPGPEPKPPAPDETAWRQWGFQALKAVSPYPQRGVDINALAGKLDAVAAQIAAGAVKDTREARELWRISANETLDGRVSEWVSFSNAFRDECESQEKAGWLTDLGQYRSMYLALARVFRDSSPRDPYKAAVAASSDDKRPVVVVITSDGCPPCKALKDEYMPRADLHGARVVHLDRASDAELITHYRLASTGMKGRIVVPQVTILRYVDDVWRQFNHTGYLGYDSMDKWVQSVFDWRQRL